MEIDIKEELKSLDRNDFKSVAKLADKIVEDIWLSSEDDDMLCAMIKDYLIDLINPDILSFK